MLTPVSTTSTWPRATRRRTSATRSDSGRERLGPRTSGITQKLHENEQPSCTFTTARIGWGAPSAGRAPRQPSPASRSPTAPGACSGAAATTCTRSPRPPSSAAASRAAQPVTTTCPAPSARARRTAWRVFATASAVTAQPFTTCTEPPAATSSRPSAASRSRSSARSVCETLQPRNWPENDVIVTVPLLLQASQRDRAPGVGGAGPVLAERVGVGAELLGDLERDPLHRHGQREDGQRLAEPVLADPVHADAEPLGAGGDLEHPLAALTPAVERHQRVAGLQRHRRPVVELLGGQALRRQVRRL